MQTFTMDSFNSIMYKIQTRIASLVLDPVMTGGLSPAFYQRHRQVNPAQRQHASMRRPPLSVGALPIPAATVVYKTVCFEHRFYSITIAVATVFAV